MYFKGHVQGGMVVVDAPAADLPEGTEVEIRVVAAVQKSDAAPSPLLKYVGAADDLPPDASQTVDQHLYGGRAS